MRKSAGSEQLAAGSLYNSQAGTEARPIKLQFLNPKSAIRNRRAYGNIFLV
jgi:hypothetical protein